MTSLWPPSSRIVGPLVTVGTLAAVELLTRWVITIPNPAPLYLLAVTYAAYIGGLRSGLVSAAITLAYSLFFFSEPGHPLTFSLENGLRVGVLAIATPALALLAGALRERVARDLREQAQLNETLDEERERLARRMSVLEGLASLSDSLSLAPDEAATATSAARSLQQNFALRGATVLFIDPSLALLEPRAGAGEATSHPVVTGAGNCPAVRSGRLFRVDGENTPVLCPYVQFRAGTRGFACVPLVAGGQTVGALFLEPGDASVMEETLLRGAADRIALHVANRRVLETAQRLAATDGLTGLYNRHFMGEQLRLLEALATRHGRAFSVIAIDVDGLKRVNDTFGHEAGDVALRGCATALRQTLRGADIPVRTGGDEFLALLPDTALAEAARVAERIRAALVAQGLAGPPTGITVSAGVATWRPGRTVEELLRAVDAVLYDAKRAGGDRVATEQTQS